MENKIKCPKCGNDEAWKAGKPRGEQQYKCKARKKKFITELNYSTEFKQKAIAIFYEGNSGRAVGRILGIVKNMCMYWIRKYAKTLKNKEVSNEQVEVIEMDELFAYTKAKKTELT